MRGALEDFCRAIGKRLFGEFHADQTIQADAVLGGLEGELSVSLGRNPDDEFSAIGPAGKRGRGDSRNREKRKALSRRI
jgi:hypothetical protein